MDKGGWETEGPRPQAPCIWDLHHPQLSGLSSLLPPKAMPEQATGCRGQGARGERRWHHPPVGILQGFHLLPQFIVLRCKCLYPVGAKQAQAQWQPPDLTPPHPHFGVTLCVARRILVPDQDLNLCPLHWEQSRNHWTTREVSLLPALPCPPASSSPCPPPSP